MCKRLVIGAIAVVVIGVAVYLLSQPKKGTVEWHKREYLRASKTYRGETLRGRIKRAYYRMQSTSPIEGAAERDAEERMRSSQQQLIQAGYLASHSVALSNQTALQVLDGFTKTPFGQQQEWEWVDVQEEGTNALSIIAKPDFVDAFKQYVSRHSPK